MAWNPSAVPVVLIIGELLLLEDGQRIMRKDLKVLKRPLGTWAKGKSNILKGKHLLLATRVLDSK